MSILPILRRIAAAFSAVVLLLLAYGVLIGSAGLTVATTPVVLSPRDEALGGLRVAVLSDLHIGSLHFPVAQIPEIVAAVEAAKPDLVLLCGDYVVTSTFVGDHVPPEPIAAALASLHARDGVYAVLGNHDHWLDGGRVARAFTAAGIPVLSDSCASRSAWR